MDSGFGVFVLLGVAPGFAVGVGLAPQAFKAMDKMNTSEIIFFIAIYCARVIKGTGIKTKIKTMIIAKASRRRFESSVVI